MSIKLTDRVCRYCHTLFSGGIRRLYCSVKCRRNQNRDIFVFRHPSRNAEQCRQSYRRHKQARMDGSRKWRAKNGWYSGPQVALYRLQNEIRIRAIRRLSEHKRRSRVQDGASFTVEEWETVKAMFYHRCAYCGIKSDKLTQDHIIPISKGGTNTIDNINPACKSCNSRKGSLSLDEFMWRLHAIS